MGSGNARMLELPLMFHYGCKNGCNRNRHSHTGSTSSRSDKSNTSITGFGSLCVTKVYSTLERGSNAVCTTASAVHRVNNFLPCRSPKP